MEMSWLVLGVMLVMCTTNAVAVQMKIKPKKASTPKNGSVEIMCDMKHPATNCSFLVRYVDYYGIQFNSVRPINFDKGHGAATVLKAIDDVPLFKASYHGAGLASGQCGVKLFDLTPGTYFVGCRARSETSGWTYDYMALVVHDSLVSQTGDLDLSNIADFEMVTVKKNETSGLIDFSVNLTSSRECRLFLPEKGSLVANASDRVEKTDIIHKAKWLATENTVSVTLLNVTSGGPLWCLCRDNPQSDFTEFYVKVVTVLEAPKDTLATKLKTTNFAEGDTLTATCVARYARPVAKIVWWLGGDVIRNNTDDDNVDEVKMDVDPHDPGEPKGYWPWRWPWNTRSIKQVLNHVLTLKDNGKQLTCQVLHPALDGGKLDFNIFTVKFITIQDDENGNLEKLSDFDIVFLCVFFIGVLAIGAILVAIYACVVKICKRLSGIFVPREIPQSNRNFDDGHYEKVDETMFSNAILVPTLPGLRKEARVGRLSVPKDCVRGKRELTPPRPEEPEYIVPDNSEAPPFPGRRTEARYGHFPVPRESAPPRPVEPEYIILDASNDSVNPDGYLRPLARSDP